MSSIATSKAARVITLADEIIDEIKTIRERYDAAQADKAYAKTLIKSIESETRSTLKKKYNELNTTLNEYLGILS